MRWRFVDPDCGTWAETLAEIPHDFYHLPQYLRLCGRQEESEAMAFVAEEGNRRLFVPFMLRELPAWSHTRSFDAVAPYGYASPILFAPSRDAGSEAFFHRAVQQFLSSLRDRNVVSAFFRLNPVLDLPLAPLQTCGALVLHGQTVVIDLTLSHEELWQQTRGGHRSEINRAKRNGYSVMIDDQWSAFNDFYDAYSETMKRVGANDFYFFTREYFQELKESMAECLRLCVVYVDGSVACAALFSEYRGVVQYHLSGTFDAFVRQYPTKVMLDFVRRWAKKRGNRWFHLGGGLGAAEDSLFQFKAGFSKLRAPFYTWRVVVDQQAYARRVAEWEARTGKSVHPLDRFFPVYRAA
jgi:hypothetical protein